MPNAYNNPDAAADFSSFLESDNGRLQKQLLYDSIAPHLPNDKLARILDAACGEGWLSAVLQENGYSAVKAFDSSEPLIELARRAHSGIDFKIADATADISYAPEEFDTVILNMAAHDLNDLSKGFKNLHAVLKPGGKFIITVANPYYSFPVGVWKRGLWGRLTGKKPQLKLRPYHEFHREGGKLFNWKDHMSSYFYPMSEYMNRALEAGFSLTAMQDLEMEQDSPKFDVQHQMHRYPIIVLLAFKKGGE